MTQSHPECEFASLIGTMAYATSQAAVFTLVISGTAITLFPLLLAESMRKAISPLPSSIPTKPRLRRKLPKNPE
jgi:hypothetical protein